MQREIKFRAFCPHEKKFHYCDFAENDYLLYGGAGSAVALNINLPWQYKNNLTFGDGPNWRIEGLIWQEFTGMKTKSGKGVYEGDIVAEKMTEEMAANGESCNVGRVFFAAGTFMIDGDGPLYEHTFSLTPDILEDYEVVGNVFENGELLK